MHYPLPLLNYPDRSPVPSISAQILRAPFKVLLFALIAGLFAFVSSAKAQLTTPAAPGVMWGRDVSRAALPVTVPKAIAGDVVSASAVGNHTFYVKSDGTLWSAGVAYSGPLPDGTTSLVGLTTPVQVTTNVASVSTSATHTLIIKNDGTLWGMGSNDGGELGDGNTSNHLFPVQIATGVKSASAGSGYSFFIKNDNTLWSMGYNSYGVLADGTTDSHAAPIQVASDVAVAAADPANGLSSYFIKTDGTLWSVGYNFAGQLGDGTTTDRLIPQQVATNVRSVVVGQWHALFIKNDGTLWAMGSNLYGTLGDGTTTDRATPVQVASSVASVSSSAAHALFFKTDGTLWGFGWNANGELGTGIPTATPVLSPIQSVSGATSAIAGGGCSLLIMADKTLRAVGDDWGGQLGDRQPLPGLTLLGKDLTAIAADSSANNLALKSDGTLWESRSLGQPLSQVPGVTNAVQAIAGPYWEQRLYLKNDGTLWKLAADDTVSQVASDVVSAAAGYSYFVYLKTDGTLWGRGGDQSLIQFGDGINPVQVADHVKSVSAAAWHILYVKQDQTLWGMGTVWGGFDINAPWGANVSTPLQLDAGIAAAYANSNQNLYIRNDGSLWTRGNGWTVYTGPEALVDTGVTSAAHGPIGTLYLKSDGVLRSRNGFQGTLGPSFAVSQGVIAVSGGPDSWTTFLQDKKYGDGPQVISQPQSLIVAPGSVATFKVVMGGTYPWAYQWFKDGVAISWGQSDQLVIPYVTGADVGSYTVVVTNSAGSVTSQTATLQIPLPPAINSTLKASGEYGKTFNYQITASNQPDDFDATGLPVGLSVDHGTGAISGVAGAAGVFNVTLAATNASGTDFKTLQLTINQAKAAITLGNFLQVYDGTPKAVTVTTSPAGLATKVTYNGNSSAPTQPGIYIVIATVTDPNYSGSSFGILVIGVLPLHIVNQPNDASVIAGHTAVFSVSVEGSGPITYQWQKGNVAIAGATKAILTITNVTAADAGKYRVLVSNGNTTLTSSVATLAVVTPVKITAQPVSLTRNVGQTASFSVTATGTGPLSYQWLKGSAPIAGATSPTLTLAHVQAASAGSYSVVVTNAAGAVTSSSATLSVH